MSKTFFKIFRRAKAIDLIIVRAETTIINWRNITANDEDCFMKFEVDNVVIVNLRNTTTMIAENAVIMIFWERSRDLMKSSIVSAKDFDDSNELSELLTWSSFDVMTFSYFLINFMIFFISSKSRHSSYYFLYFFHLIRYFDSRALWRLFIMSDNSHDFTFEISSFTYTKSEYVSRTRRNEFASKDEQNFSYVIVNTEWILQCSKTTKW